MAVISVDRRTIVDDIFQGFVDWRKLLGPEKVSNGSFTGGSTGWTLGSGWTYNANAVDRDGAGTATMTQDVGSVAGEIYRVEFEITAYTDGSVTVSIGGTSGTARSSAAVFVEYIKAADTTALTFTPTAGATFTIDNVSVKKVGYVNADGITIWIEDRGATAGKGALHIITEDGTKHVIGDRVGIGTHDPANVHLDIAGNIQISNILYIASTGGGIYSASADASTVIFVARNAAGQTQTVLTIVGAATVANSYITAQVGGTWTLASGVTWTLPALTMNGALTLNNNTQIMMKDTAATAYEVFNLFTDNNLYVSLQTAGSFIFRTSNASPPNLLQRLVISGNAATAVATWSAITHTGIVITSAGVVEGAGTGANGFKLKNLKNAAATALSGTQLDVEIDIGGTPYYFTVYPTKA